MNLKYIISISILCLFMTCAAPKIEGEQGLNLELKVDSENLKEDLYILQKRLIEYGYQKQQISITEKNGKVNLVLSDINNIDDIRFLVHIQGIFSSWEKVQGDDVLTLLEKYYDNIKDSLKINPLSDNTDQLFEQEQQPVIQSFKTQVLDKLSINKFDNEIYIKCLAKDTFFINQLIFNSNALNQNYNFTWLDNSKNVQFTDIELIVLTEKSFSFNDYLDKISWHFGSGEAIDLTLKLDDTGTKLFEKYTTERLGKRISFLIDNQVLIAPIIQSKISEGNISINGLNKLKNFEALFALVKGGIYKQKISIIREKLVEKSYN